MTTRQERKQNASKKIATVHENITRSLIERSEAALSPDLKRRGVDRAVEHVLRNPNPAKLTGDTGDVVWKRAMFSYVCSPETRNVVTENIKKRFAECEQEEISEKAS